MSFVVSYQFLTSSHWFPLVGCGVLVGLNDGSMKPSLAYVSPPVLFEPWVNLIFEAVHCLAVHCILTQLVPSIHYSMCEEIFPHIQSAVLFENGQRVTSSASGGA